MRELTKEQVRQRLAAPNGSELLFGEAEAAFGAAWALFAEEGNAAACAFLCRCAKRQAYAARIGALLGEDRTALYAALRSDAPKLRTNDARDVPALVSALAAEGQRFVRPSLLLALGACGGEEAKAALDAYTVAPPVDAGEERHAREEAEALASARKSFLHLSKHAFSGLPKAYALELRTPDKLEGSLA